MPANQPQWSVRPDGSVWISHYRLSPSDLDRLHGVSHLTAWNVAMPEGFLAELRSLRWLDLRRGSSAGLDCLAECSRLRGLVVNQVRGLRDASMIETLADLEVLSLYGLAQLAMLPELGKLPMLRCLYLGQLRSLNDWTALMHVPALEELMFLNKLRPDLEVMRELGRHPRLRAFGWSAPDEPAGKIRGVLEAVGRPSPKPTRPEQWFAQNC